MKTKKGGKETKFQSSQTSQSNESRKEELFVLKHFFFYLEDIYNKVNAIKLMKKAIPNAFANGIEGFGVNPIVLTIKK